MSELAPILCPRVCPYLTTQEGQAEDKAQDTEQCAVWLVILIQKSSKVTATVGDLENKIPLKHAHKRDRQIYRDKDIK